MLLDHLNNLIREHLPPHNHSVHCSESEKSKDRYKTWTLDSGLDCGLDYGLDYGLDFGLNWTVNSVLDLPCKEDFEC